MDKGTSCHSGINNVSLQTGCVESMAQQKKDHLKECLQEIIESKQITSPKYQYATYWLKNYLLGKQSINKRFLLFLINYLSLENTAIIKPEEVSHLYSVYNAFHEQDIDVFSVYILFNQSGMLKISDQKDWMFVNNMLQFVLNATSNEQNCLLDSLSEIVSKYLRIFVEYPDVFKDVKDMGLLHSKHFVKYIHVASIKQLVNGFDILRSVLCLSVTNSRFRSALLREVLNRICKSVCKDSDQLVSETVNIYSERILVSDKYLNLYEVTNARLIKILEFVLNEKPESNIHIIKALLELNNNQMPGIKNAIDFLYDIPVVFNIPEDELIEMLIGLQEKWELFSLDNSYSSKYSNVDYFQLFWIMQMYVRHSEYTILTFEQALSNIWSNFFKSYDLKELFSELFFKYEKPYILIMNMTPSVFPVLEFLIQNNRINHYPKLPIYLTKKERTLFYTWESCFDVPKLDSHVMQNALMYAKFLKRGLDDEIITEILGFVNSNNLNFWLGMAPFFVRYQKYIRKAEIRDILDYMHSHPNLKIKGRTLNSMRRLIGYWHYELLEENYSDEYRAKEWEKAPIEDYYYSNIYRIIQYNRAEQLISESKALKHCIASYLDRCIKKESVVFSLQEQIREDEYKPVITIEVVNRNVMQAKGKYNREPSESEIDMIFSWAEKNDLDTCQLEL